MYRGTTPTIEIEVDTEIDFDEIAELWLTFKTHTVEITKELNEVDLDNENKKITVALSQSETLKFADDSKVEVQLRGRMNDNIAWASDIAVTTAKRILKGGKI